MKLKDLIRLGIVKVEVTCGNCHAEFGIQHEKCPLCGYEYKKEKIKEII